MKKNSKPKKPILYKQNDEMSKAEEPTPVYRSVKIIPSLKDFTYNEFKKNADKTPFTQTEWAAMLHVSERTLQRYAKNNGTFSFINAERFQQIMNVIERGKKIFNKTEYFYEWLNSNPPALEGNLSVASLTTYDGIQKTLAQLGRIEHGILA
jgi:putative toxin-antitoxin system antitoxin component (TIGR02293 family)